MGAEQSQHVEVPSNTGLQILRKEVWNALGVRDDPRYGEFKLFGNHERQIAIVHKTCQDYTEYAALCSKLSKAKELNAIPGMVKLLEISSLEEGNLCSSFYKVTAVYEYLDTVVENYYSELMGHPSSTEMVVGFLGQMISTLNDLYAAGVIHGDVTPKSILIQRLNNQLFFKLNNVQQMTGFNQYKRALLESEECRWHLAPELLESLFRRELRPQYDSQKSDVYSLGLTALELGTGKIGLGGLYDLEKVTLNKNVLEALLERFAQIHGVPLTQILRMMLTEEVHHRANFNELNRAFCEFIAGKVPEVEKQPKAPSQILNPSHQPIFSQSKKLSPSRGNSPVRNPRVSLPKQDVTNPNVQNHPPHMESTRNHNQQLNPQQHNHQVNQNIPVNQHNQSIVQNLHTSNSQYLPYQPQLQQQLIQIQDLQPVSPQYSGQQLLTTQSQPKFDTTESRSQLHDQTNIIKSPTPVHQKKQLFSSKPQSSTATLRRPNTQTQFKPTTKKTVMPTAVRKIK